MQRFQSTAQLFARQNSLKRSRNEQTRTNEQVQLPSRHHRTHPSRTIKLERPEVIYSNNHLCVVNKPAGWKSQPGDGGHNNRGRDPKCLLTYLKSQSEGGGSSKDFIIPAHRLDQPCTGVLIFVKNRKAASRVQVAWSKQEVSKVYWVVVESGDSDGLETLQRRSEPLPNEGGRQIFRLSAVLKTNKPPRSGARRSNKIAGSSVKVKPLSKDTKSSDGRVCHIEWQHLLKVGSSGPGSRHLLSVKTDTGAKHQVRALLGLAGGCPTAGDLRYGNSNNSQSYRGQGQQGRVDEPLPDGSVALHARSISLPTVKLGGMESLRDEPFVAPIPKRWTKFFGIREKDVVGF